MALVVQKEVIQVEYPEENDYHYVKERLYYINWIKRLGIVAVIVAIASIVLASIQLTSYVSFLTVSLVIAAVIFFFSGILSIVWATRAGRTYKAEGELFQPRINDRLTKAVFVLGLLLAGGAAVVLVNLYVQQEYPADYIRAQNTNASSWNDHYEGRTENGLVNYSKTHFIIQGCFAGFFFFYFLLASRAAFRCLKWSNQAMSYLVFLGNVLLLAFGLGVVYFANHVFGYGDYPQVRAHFPVWNIRGLFFIGIAISTLSLVGFLVDHRSWRVGFFVLAFLLLVLLVLLVNFTGYAYRHQRQTYEYYKGVNNTGTCIDRMKLVHEADLEDYGCPRKYVPLDQCESSQTAQKWEYTSQDNTGVVKPAPVEPAQPAPEHKVSSGSNSQVAAPTLKTTTKSDGTVITERPDGSTVTVAPDGTTTTKNADGTTTTSNPDGTTTTRNKDGTQTTTQSDGTSTNTKKDGTAVTSSPDGSTTVTNKDGTTTTTNTDGSTTTTQKDGTVVTKYSDGTTVTSQPDGTKTTNAPDGSTTINYSDGSYYFKDAQGNIYLRQPDGTTTQRLVNGTTNTKSPDGTITSTQPDGSTTTLEPDGTKSTKYADGTIATQQKDGTLVTTRTDGTVTTKLPNGTTITRKPDDTTITIQPDGTTTTRSADGKTVTTTQPDGTTTTTTSSLFYDAPYHTAFVGDLDTFNGNYRSLDSDTAEYCLNTRCCGLLGELYTEPFLSLANFGLAATLAGCLVSIGCYYFWYVTWVDSARDKKKDFIWLGFMAVITIVFFGLLFGLDPNYVHERLGPNANHL